MGNEIIYGQDGPVALITWNRPDQLNAINEPLEVQFGETLRKADKDPSVKVVVVKGAGPCPKRAVVRASCREFESKVAVSGEECYTGESSF